MSRALPNIIITGTPGTGKTTHCEMLAEQCPELKHLSVNQIVKERECHEGWDEEYQSWIVDEDKVRRLSSAHNLPPSSCPRPPPPPKKKPKTVFQKSTMAVLILTAG